MYPIQIVRNTRSGFCDQRKGNKLTMHLSFCENSSAYYRTPLHRWTCKSFFYDVVSLFARSSPCWRLFCALSILPMKTLRSSSQAKNFARCRENSFCCYGIHPRINCIYAKRGLCPSCGAKRAVKFGEHLYDSVLEKVPHRHCGFTLPKRLRVYFRYDRSLNNILF